MGQLGDALAEHFKRKDEEKKQKVSESPSVTGYKACPFCGGVIYSPANIKKNKALSMIFFVF